MACCSTALFMGADAAQPRGGISFASAHTISTFVAENLPMHRPVLLFVLIALLALPALAANARPVFIEEMTWTEIQQAIASGSDTAIYYAGSTEQNGPHMVTGKHNFIARNVARQIAEKLGHTLVYPIMPFAPTGDPATRTGHMRFPGSVSLSEATFAAVARDVAFSARAAGFHNILLMGDHGDGQEALARVATELSALWKAEGIRVLHVSDLYFRSAELEREYLAKQGYATGEHAALADTSALMAIDRTAKWVRGDKLAQARGDGQNGIEGDARHASARFGKTLIDIKINSAITQIRKMLADCCH